MKKVQLSIVSCDRKQWVAVEAEDPSGLLEGHCVETNTKLRVLKQSTDHRTRFKDRKYADDFMKKSSYTHANPSTGVWITIPTGTDHNSRLLAVHSSNSPNPFPSPSVHLSTLRDQGRAVQSPHPFHLFIFKYNPSFINAPLDYYMTTSVLLLCIKNWSPLTQQVVKTSHSLTPYCSYSDS